MAPHLAEAGFDVLIVDRRGNGLSGGRNSCNTAEQANDIFRELTQMDSGEGLRVLTPAGEVKQGGEAAKVLLGKPVADVPIVVAGFSRGS